MKNSIKNTIKTLAVGAVAVPCALLLTACGDSAVKVDTKGNYTDTTVAEATTYFEEVQANEKWDFTGLKFTARMFMDMNAMDGEESSSLGMTMDMTINGVVSYADEILAKCDTTTKTKMTVAEQTQEATLKGNVYIKDNFIYTNNGTTKIKMPLEQSDSAGPDDITNVIPSTDLVNGYWDQIENGTDSVLKVATKGTTVKYQLATEVVEGQTIEMYLIFEKGQLTAFKLNVEMKGANDAVIYSISIDAVTTNETVKITENLDEYLDFSDLSGTLIG
ncbi:MAG: hypothetical protein NC218_12440 [Acetobacter sp.]|nr:hypothetical protein [Acetobacter sp.]